MLHPKIYRRRGRWGFQWFRNGKFVYGTNSLKRWMKYPFVRRAPKIHECPIDGDLGSVPIN